MIEASQHAPVRVLWLMTNDQPKADTISLVRWLRASRPEAVSLTAGFISEPSGRPGPAGEFITPDGARQTVPEALRACRADVMHWPRRGLLKSRHVRDIADFVSRNGIEIVVSVYLGADLVASRLRRRTSANWIVRAGGIGQFRRVRLYAGDWFDRLVYRRADGFLANSQAVRQDWSARLNRPADCFAVVHNPAPPPPQSLTPRQQVRDRLGIGSDEPMLLTVSRLDREKGIELLIDAAAALCGSAAICKLRFVVLGEGPLRARLARLIERRGLSGRVVLGGASDDVWSHLAAADLFVLPSRMEGCPNALLEAASSGLPIVAFGVGAVPELLADSQQALLAPLSGGPAGLAERIVRLLADAALARGLAAAARQRMRSQFSPAAIALAHQQFLHKVARLQVAPQTSI